MLFGRLYGSIPRLGAWLLALVLLPGLSIPASAGGDKDPLVVGVFPRRDADTTRELFKPLMTYLASELGRAVQLKTSYDFASFWDHVAERDYDLVHYNQYHYIRSHKEYGYKVILRNEEFGRSRIAAAIVVRKDADIDELADLRHKKVVFGGGRGAMISYIAASYLLRQAGLEKGDYLVQFALTPPKICRAVYYRQAAAGGAGNRVLSFPGVRDQVDVGKLEYLAVGEPLAHLPWAVSPEVTQRVSRRIKEALANAEQTREGSKALRRAKLTGLIPATDEDYDPHRAMVRDVLGESY